MFFAHALHSAEVGHGQRVALRARDMPGATFFSVSSSM